MYFFFFFFLSTERSLSRISLRSFPSHRTRSLEQIKAREKKSGAPFTRDARICTDPTGSRIGKCTLEQKLG